MKQKRKVKKPRNPTDATMRNIRALKKRVKKLEDKIVPLEAFVRHLLKHVSR